MSNTYAKAYTEILEILKYLPKEELSRIPKEKIQFYEKNKDDTYVYRYDATKTLEEQKVSRKTKVIILSLFDDFFATPVQKEKLKVILKQNEEKYQIKLREKYNPDSIFQKTNKNSNVEISENNDETKLIEYKETFLTKIKNFIFRILHINK